MFLDLNLLSANEHFYLAVLDFQADCHGLDYAAQEADVKTMYENPEARDSLLEKYNVTYIVIGPWENGSYSIPDINAFAENYDCVYNKNGILVFEV